MSANQRVAIVTGGARGIGRRTAELLASRGYRVLIIDLHDPVATLQAIAAAGGEASGYAGDLTDPAVIERFVPWAFDRYGRVDVLVNNAGISLIAPAEHTTLSDLRRVLGCAPAGRFLFGGFGPPRFQFALVNAHGPIVIGFLARSTCSG